MTGEGYSPTRASRTWLGLDDRDAVRGREENRLRLVSALNALGASVFCFSSSDPPRMLLGGSDGKCDALEDDQAADTGGSGRATQLEARQSSHWVRTDVWQFARRDSPSCSPGVVQGPPGVLGRPLPSFNRLVWPPPLADSPCVVT